MPSEHVLFLITTTTNPIISSVSTYCLFSFLFFSFPLFFLQIYSNKFIAKKKHTHTRFNFYLFFISGTTQSLDVTALSIASEDNNIVYSIHDTKTIQIVTMLLIFSVIMYYVLRNLIYTISELLIDYMDPEHDMIMKLFKVFFYSLMFILFPYLASDVIFLSILY